VELDHGATAAVEIPAKRTAQQLIDIVEDLDWTRQGPMPALIYEKTPGLRVPDPQFWLKLGLLLFDSGNYPQSFGAFEKIRSLDASTLLRFTARKEDPGLAMQHSQDRMSIDRRWVEERLRTPFTRQK